MAVNGSLSLDCLIYDDEIYYNVLVPPECKNIPSIELALLSQKMNK